ncbi:Gfo/Idh/MocA family protein [Devosia nitrariae]|uniref:Oxidoreductase n=1 Tax=Devosia nitrariae TaxID=2071872 RepID=A0ABQ5VZP5_9HYPH|nr:Gfo/Idh/MocA family oxidoreductase [Devosia nitrariae]GLQ53073.1 oxidoreductase [Devosia nitrariae]
MPEPLRIAMVGAGWVTQYHLPAWQAMADRAEVVAICDPDIEAARRRAREFGIPAVFQHAEAMLTGVEIDAVDICAPREFHADLVRLAARHGLPVLCQKPLATDLDAATDLVAEVDGGVPLMVHENWRFRPHYRRLRDWIDEGLVGTIRHVELEFHSSGMIPDGRGVRPALERQPFFTTLDRLLVMEVLIHHLDTLRFLLGEMVVDTARLWRTNDEIKGEDVASIALHSMTDSTAIFVSGNLAVHGAPPVPRDRLRIFGERGIVSLEGGTLRLEGDEVREEAFDLEASYRQSYTGAIGHFLDGLGRGGRFETGARDNLMTLELVETIYRLSGFEKPNPT